MNFLYFLLYVVIAVLVFLYFRFKDRTPLSADTSMPWTLELLIAVLWFPALVFLMLGMGWNGLRGVHDALVKPKSP